MAAWAIYQSKDGTYSVRHDRGELLDARRACGVGSNEGGEEIAVEWNRTAALAASVRERRLKDESVISMGTDALNESEQPTDTTPRAASRLELVSIREGVR